jgi:hypothetical protein
MLGKAVEPTLRPSRSINPDQRCRVLPARGCSGTDWPYDYRDPEIRCFRMMIGRLLIREFCPRNLSILIDFDRLSPCNMCR